LETLIFFCQKNGGSSLPILNHSFNEMEEMKLSHIMFADFKKIANFGLPVNWQTNLKILVNEKNSYFW